MPDGTGAEGKRERFEWRHSSGPEVSALEGRSRGLKLVRVGTGEVVAAYAKTGMSARKIGKFRWVSNEEWGEEAGILVVISLLAIVERERRDEKRRA